MPAIRFPEFRAELEHTNYPFSDIAPLTNSVGEFFGESVFLDASFYVIGGGERLYLSRVNVSNNQVTLYLGDATTAEIASGTFSLLSPPDEVAFLDLYGRPAGVIISDASRLSSFNTWAPGDHVFALGETEFAAAVCMPTPETGVRGLLLPDGRALAGEVWLVGDDGVVLRHEEVTVPTPDGAATRTQQIIRVDLVGDPLFRRRLCETPDFFQTPRFITQLTIQQGARRFTAYPDAFGDFKITVGSNEAEDTVLRTRAVPGGLIVEAVGQQMEEP